ncbi:hypothetical protein F53441_422 [Fusarium austroafricanum]|uniref:Uncharacterized protein n=1 Tax=Fusarium austroafricanum TaxID=2364996 RepID=A0A8H4KWV5_9HYPO|nr:hypothetical protein F53441_422 [Fusarium austroafricanum]
MATPSEPSYLLADFPSGPEEPLRASNMKDPSTTESSIKDAESKPTRGSPNKEGHFRNRFTPGRVFADFTLILLPLAVFGFAIAVALLDGKAIQKEEQRKWENAITVTASIFPILFASVVGRMVYEVARWKLEQGATLNLVEQLIGSRTVGSTITTLISFGRFNILGLALLVLWAFLPLGSQSVLRMLRTQQESQVEPSNLLYFSTDAQSIFAQLGTSNITTYHDKASLLKSIQAMYAALFVTSAAAKPDAMDIWGNVEIPRLEVQSEDWHDVSLNPQPDSYAALVGLPVLDVSPGNSTFTIESSYIELRCSKLDWDGEALGKQSQTPWTDPDLDDPEKEPRLNGTWHEANMTTNLTLWSIALDRFVGPEWEEHTLRSVKSNKTNMPTMFENATDLKVTHAKLLFAASFWSDYHVTADCNTECDVVQRYIESRVTCSRVDLSAPQNCPVTAQRTSRQKHPPEGVTMLSWQRNWGHVTRLPTVLSSSVFYPDIMLRYLDDPKLKNLIKIGGEKDWKLLKGVSAEKFGHRLSQVINTYLVMGQLYPWATEPTDPKDIWSDPKTRGFMPNNTVPVYVINLVEVYFVNWSWMAVFLISCTVLVLSGTARAVYAHLAVGPEILGYASAVRDSKYIDLPPEVGQKDALDVTNIMGQKRIKYGFTSSVFGNGRPLVGIGLEDQTRGIRRNQSSLP